MKKAIYLPTGAKTVVLSCASGYCEILLDGEYKTVAQSNLAFEDETVTISTLAELKRSIFVHCIKNPLSDILYSYNTNRLTPEPHQYKPLIKFLHSENNRILIADEVGLGKTIEAGMIYKEIDKRHDLKVSLIVVPSSLTLKWKEELALRFDEAFEIKKTTQFLNFIKEYDDYHTAKLIHEKIIISYHTLRDERVMARLKESFLEIDFLIMDEAHTMRNGDTSTFKSGRLITSMAEHIVFLTATPVQNSLNDLFNILSLLEEDYFKDYGYFIRMISPNAHIHKLIALLRNHHPLEEIQAFVSETIETVTVPQVRQLFAEVLDLTTLDQACRVTWIDRLTAADHLSFIINRSKKKDVGRSLPRNAKSLIVEITEEEQAYYDAVITFVKFIYPHVPPGFITIMPERMASSSMLASLESFRQIRESGRILISDEERDEEHYLELKKEEQIATAYLEDILAKGARIGREDSKFIKFVEILEELDGQKIQQKIVFSFFKKTLDYLEIKLQDLGYRVGKIHGDFSVEERFGVIKAFKRGEFDILLSSEVGSEGLDMQFCNVIINYDLPWNPMRVEQRIGRIDRIGQRFDKLHIFNLCIAGSIEDRIYNRLYSKLGIFESSIGELEPILGDLNEQLNIPELIDLSQEEIDARLHLTELALKRKELEIAEQNAEVEKLINDDIHHATREQTLLHPHKIAILQEQSREIFVAFLQEQDIGYLELKDGTLKLSSDNRKKLFEQLKRSMSDKRTAPLRYKEERSLLQKIHRLSELKISFSTNHTDDPGTLHLDPASPILHMITRGQDQQTLHAHLTHAKYPQGYAVIYRVDFQQLKERSFIKTVILDADFGLVDEVDYFEFIAGCGEGEEIPETDFARIRSAAMPYITRSIEQQEHQESATQQRLIDVKIESLSNYFAKQITRAQKVHQKSHQEDIIRMKAGEVENLIHLRDEKIAKLEQQKRVSSQFEILGIVRITA